MLERKERHRVLLVFRVQQEAMTSRDTKDFKQFSLPRSVCRFLQMFEQFLTKVHTTTGGHSKHPMEVV